MTNKFIPPQTTTSTRTSATPLDGELLYDTDEKDLYVGDGTTTGGKKVQTEGSPTNGTILKHVTTPSAPAAGNTIVYGKSDGKIYKRAAGGSEEEIGSSNGFTLTATKTSNYTANNKEEIPCNTITTGAFTITTPTSGEFAVFDIGGTTPTTGFGVNNLTITPASGTIMGTISYVLDVGAVRRRFILVGTDWRVA